MRRLFAVVLLLPLAGCGGGQAGDAESFADGGTFTTSIPSDPGNLDPLQVANQTANVVTSFAYDSLVGMNEKGEPVPQLASEWDVTPTSVTYTLREGITCADGSPLTASQVAANFEYIQDPANQSSAIGSELPDTEFTVTADDAARTVTIKRDQPYGFLLPGAGAVRIVCAKGTADRTLLAAGTAGTGPFTLVEAVPGDHYTLEVRKDYRWGPDGATTDTPGFPAKVVIKVVENQSTAVNLMLNGQLSEVAAIGTERQRLAGKGFTEVTQAGVLFEMFFNQQAGKPGAELDVREALATAVDRDRLRKVLTENDPESREPEGLVNNEPRACDFNSVSGNLPNHDQKAAKAALDGKRFPLTVMYPSGTPSVDAGMELLAGWWQELGVDVKLKPTDGNVMNQNLFSNPESWDVAVLSIGVNFPSELVTFLSGPAPPDGQNFPAVANPDYDQLVGEAGQTPGAAGCELWGQAEKALFQRFDVLPISVGVVHNYLNKARYRVGVYGPEPTSIRLLAG